MFELTYGLVYIGKLLICYKITDLDTQDRGYDVYSGMFCIMVLSARAILCACGEVTHNTHSYCKMHKCGKSSIVLRFGVKSTSPAQLTVKIKDCWICESGTDYCVKRQSLDHWERIQHLLRKSRVSLWSSNIIIDCTKYKSMWLLLKHSQPTFSSSRCLDVFLHHRHIDPSGTGLCALCGWIKPLCLRWGFFFHPSLS